MSPAQYSLTSAESWHKAPIISFHVKEQTLTFLKLQFLCGSCVVLLVLQTQAGLSGSSCVCAAGNAASVPDYFIRGDHVTYPSAEGVMSLETSAEKLLPAHPPLSFGDTVKGYRWSRPRSSCTNTTHTHTHRRTHTHAHTRLYITVFTHTCIIYMYLVLTNTHTHTHTHTHT